MENQIQDVILKMILHESGNPFRAHHFLKVYGFAKTIGEAECLSQPTQKILEIAAAMHDIGIKPSLEKYGSSAGAYQEIEGPPLARKLLGELGFEAKLIERVCYLIGHHHTYSKIDGLDHQILVEADFLVNLFEEGADLPTIQRVREKIFQTRTGTKILDVLFLA